MAHSPFLFLIISSFLVPTALSANDSDLTRDYNLPSCTDNSTRDGSDTYTNNLNNLLQKLYNDTPQNEGFSNTSSGQGPDQAYGLALCRGDVTMEDCRACLDSARGNITEYCPHGQSAIAWRDFCLLKYSNTSFAGKIDTRNRVGLINVEKWKNKTSSEIAVGLLRHLSRGAPGLKKMYAEGINATTKVEGNETMYGMVQCTRDLNKSDCRTCLETAIDKISSCCADRIGARYLYASCQVRYEVYQFLN